MSTLKIANIASGIVSIVIGGLFYFLTFSFPKIETDVLGPDFLPRFYCILLILFGLILVIQGVIKKNSNEETEIQRGKTVGYALSSMAIVFLYIIVLPYIGFYISTVLAMVALLYFSKIRKLPVLVGVPLAVALFVFIIFEKLLKVPVPTGSLFL